MTMEAVQIVCVYANVPRCSHVCVFCVQMCANAASMCAHVCACARVRACVRGWVRAWVRACACFHVSAAHEPDLIKCKRAARAAARALALRKNRPS